MKIQRHTKQIRIIAGGVLGISALILSLCLQLAPVQADNGSTAVSATLLPGVLSLAAPVAATLSSVTLNGSGSQTASGSLGLTTVADARGSNAGWSLTATTSAFTQVMAPVRVSGTAGTLTTAGSYLGSTPGTYTVTIVTAGTLGTAVYSVGGLETQTAQLAGAAVPLGTRGLNLNFSNATYTVGEQWTIEVATIPASKLTVTPSAVTVSSGSSNGVSAGAAYTYSTGSDPAPLMTASSGNGGGTYTNTPALALTIPSGSRSGVYTATITETVN